MQSAIEYLTTIKTSAYDLRTFSLESQDYKDRKGEHEKLFNATSPLYTSCNVNTNHFAVFLCIDTDTQLDRSQLLTGTSKTSPTRLQSLSMRRTSKMPRESYSQPPEASDFSSHRAALVHRTNQVSGFRISVFDLAIVDFYLSHATNLLLLHFDPPHYQHMLIPVYHNNISFPFIPIPCLNIASSFFFDCRQERT